MTVLCPSGLSLLCVVGYGHAWMYVAPPTTPPLRQS